MDAVKPGFIFETVFWIDGEDEAAGLVARNVNGKVNRRRIVTDDRRVLPGQRCKVKVEEVQADAVRVSYLGLVELALEPGIWVEPSLLRQFEILLCSGRSILLEGPQGTGKTTISRALADSLGMTYVFFNCSVCFSPEDFVGSLQLAVDEAGQASTRWVPTEVLAAIREANSNPGQRYLIFLDELNRTRSHALNGIMSAIDSSRRIFDPDSNRYEPIPDNIQWIAAINRGRQFSGTYALDVAQLDRFAILKMDYPPEAREVEILGRRFDMVKPKLIRKVVKIANQIRAEPRIYSDLSMRATDEACLFLSYPTLQRKVSDEELGEILRTSFCNRLPGSVDEEESEAQVAWSLIERALLLEDLVDG